MACTVPKNSMTTGLTYALPCYAMPSTNLGWTHGQMQPYVRCPVTPHARTAKKVLRNRTHHGCSSRAVSLPFWGLPSIRTNLFEMWGESYCCMMGLWTGPAGPVGWKGTRMHNGEVEAHRNAHAQPQTLHDHRLYLCHAMLSPGMHTLAWVIGHALPQIHAVPHTNMNLCMECTHHAYTASPL